MASCRGGNLGGRDELTGSLTGRVGASFARATLILPTFALASFGMGSLDVKPNQGVAGTPNFWDMIFRACRVFGPALEE